jgi:hypothetical protein
MTEFLISNLVHTIRYIADDTETNYVIASTINYPLIIHVAIQTILSPDRDDVYSLFLPLFQTLILNRFLPSSPKHE